MLLSSNVLCDCVTVTVCVCRTMLTKDKKPDEKAAGKEAVQVIPPRPDTPEMFKAALKVTEQVGIEGVFSKLKTSYKPSESSAEVRLIQLLFTWFHAAPLTACRGQQRAERQSCVRKQQQRGRTWTCFCFTVFKGSVCDCYQ